MVKILLTILAFIFIAFVVVAMYCAMVVAGRSDDNGNDENNGGDDIEMFFKKQICPRCKTGKDSYDLDQHSEACPYIGCWKKGKCSFFEPLDTTSKKGIFSGFKNKRSVTPPRKIAIRWAFGGLSEVNKIRSIS